MCVAVPVRVVEVMEAGRVRCRVGESETFVEASGALLEDEPRVGDYIIIHAGFALRKLEPDDAEETLRLLREMAEAVEEDLRKHAQGSPAA